MTDATPMQLLAASVPAYPADYPIADRSPYSYQVDMGVIRSEMAAGNFRQRRVFKNMPHAIALVFHMSIETLHSWQAWVNENAYAYFTCPISTMYAGGPPTPGNIRAEVLRFTSDLAIAMDGFDYVAVTVGAELAPDAYVSSAYALNAPVAGGNWVIDGTPPAPSDPDDIIAGTPAAPASPTVSGGTPGAPASHV